VCDHPAMARDHHAPPRWAVLRSDRASQATPSATASGRPLRRRPVVGGPPLPQSCPSGHRRLIWLPLVDTRPQATLFCSRSPGHPLPSRAPRSDRGPDDLSRSSPEHSGDGGGTETPPVEKRPERGSAAPLPGRVPVRRVVVGADRAQPLSVSLLVIQPVGGVTQHEGLSYGPQVPRAIRGSRPELAVTIPHRPRNAQIRSNRSATPAPALTRKAIGDGPVRTRCLARPSPVAARGALALRRGR